MMNIILEQDGYVLTRPMNTWDMNFHLLDTNNNKEYLIDTCDFHEVYTGFEEINDLEELIDLSWKTKGEINEAFSLKIGLRGLGV